MYPAYQQHPYEVSHIQGGTAQDWQNAPLAQEQQPTSTPQAGHQAALSIPSQKVAQQHPQQFSAAPQQQHASSPGPPSMTVQIGQQLFTFPVPDGMSILEAVSALSKQLNPSSAQPGYPPVVPPLPLPGYINCAVSPRQNTQSPGLSPQQVVATAAKGFAFAISPFAATPLQQSSLHTQPLVQLQGQTLVQPLTVLDTRPLLQLEGQREAQHLVQTQALPLVQLLAHPQAQSQPSRIPPPPAQSIRNSVTSVRVAHPQHEPSWVGSPNSRAQLHPAANPNHKHQDQPQMASNPSMDRMNSLLEAIQYQQQGVGSTPQGISVQPAAGQPMLKRVLSGEVAPSGKRRAAPHIEPSLTRLSYDDSSAAINRAHSGSQDRTSEKDLPSLDHQRSVSRQWPHAESSAPPSPIPMLPSGPKVFASTPFPVPLLPAILSLGVDLQDEPSFGPHLQCPTQAVGASPGLATNAAKVCSSRPTQEIGSHPSPPPSSCGHLPLQRCSEGPAWEAAGSHALTVSLACDRMTTHADATLSFPAHISRAASAEQLLSFSAGGTSPRGGLPKWDGLAVPSGAVREVHGKVWASSNSGQTDLTQPDISLLVYQSHRQPYQPTSARSTGHIPYPLDAASAFAHGDVWERLQAPALPCPLSTQLAPGCTGPVTAATPASFQVMFPQRAHSAPISALGTTTAEADTPQTSQLQQLSPTTRHSTGLTQLMEIAHNITGQGEHVPGHLMAQQAPEQSAIRLPLSENLLDITVPNQGQAWSQQTLSLQTPRAMPAEVQQKQQRAHQWQHQVSPQQGQPQEQQWQQLPGQQRQPQGPQQTQHLGQGWQCEAPASQLLTARMSLHQSTARDTTAMEEALLHVMRIVGNTPRGRPAKHILPGVNRMALRFHVGLRVQGMVHNLGACDSQLAAEMLLDMVRIGTGLYVGAVAPGTPPPHPVLHPSSQSVTSLALPGSVYSSGNVQRVVAQLLIRGLLPATGPEEGGDLTRGGGAWEELELSHAHARAMYAGCVPAEQYFGRSGALAARGPLARNSKVTQPATGGRARAANQGAQAQQNGAWEAQRLAKPGNFLPTRSGPMQGMDGRGTGAAMAGGGLGRAPSLSGGAGVAMKPNSVGVLGDGQGWAAEGPMHTLQLWGPGEMMQPPGGAPGWLIPQHIPAQLQQGVSPWGPTGHSQWLAPLQLSSLSPMASVGGTPAWPDAQSAMQMLPGFGLQLPGQTGPCSMLHHPGLQGGRMQLQPGLLGASSMLQTHSGFQASGQGASPRGEIQLQTGYAPSLIDTSSLQHAKHGSSPPT